MEYISIWKDRLTQTALVLFIVLTGWWLWLYMTGSTDTLGNQNLLFGALYGTTMSLFGVVVGLMSARYWGGWKSIMGRAMIVLSIGLFGQFIGQFAFSFYNIVQGVDIPYPSLADVGYFGNIPFYAFGIILLAKASGAGANIKQLKSILFAVIVPVLMIGLSYFLFLREYDFTDVHALTALLDFGYPLGLGLNVSLILIAYQLSRKMLGGIMKSRVLFLVLAFVAQYVADFNFLYQNLQGTWYNGGYGDYLYLVAYFFMAVGIFQLRAVAIALRKSNHSA